MAESFNLKNMKIDKSFDLELFNPSYRKKGKLKNKDSEFKCIIEPINKISINNIGGIFYYSTSEELNIKILAMLQHMYRIYITDYNSIDSIKKYCKSQKKPFRKNGNGYFPIFWGVIDIEIENLDILYDADISIDTHKYYTSRMDSSLKNLKNVRRTKKLDDYFRHEIEKDTKSDINVVAMNKYKEHPRLKGFVNHVAEYYSKIVYREYLTLKEPLIVKCTTTGEMYDYLKNTPHNNDCFLGTSESLVNVKLLF